MQNSKCHAVLTGDLVRSRDLSPQQLEQARSRLNDAVKEMKGWRRGMITGSMDFFRGDSWQLLVSEPGRALRVALFLRASLIMADLPDTRTAIGLGLVSSVSSRRISQSSGKAFELSGQALDGLPHGCWFTIALPTDNEPLAGWLAVAARLSDALIRRWTTRQAEVVRLALHPDEPLHEEMAARLDPPVSKQTVTKTLVGADWNSLLEAVRLFETTGWEKLTGVPA